MSLLGLSHVPFLAGLLLLAGLFAYLAHRDHES